MPDNTLTPDCLRRIGGAQLFMSPTWNPEQKGVKVQIIDVFALDASDGLRQGPRGKAPPQLRAISQRWEDLVTGEGVSTCPNRRTSPSLGGPT
jgi:hypothetical protein